MSRAFICCPLNGDIENNINKAIAYAKYVYDSKKMFPIVPHLLALVLDDNDPEQRALGTSWGLNQVLLASEIWVFGNKTTSGMSAEIKLAEDFAIKRRDVTDEECEKILKKYG